MNGSTGTGATNSGSGSPMTVRELMTLFYARRILIAAWTLAGLAIASALVAFAPAQWEATAVARIGRVGQRADAGSCRDQNLVETPSRVLERLKLRVFQDAVLNRLQISPDDSNASAGLYRGSLKPRVMQSADLVEIRIRAWSKDEARNWAETTVRHLGEVHAALAEPSLRRLRAQLENAQKALARAEASRTRLLDGLPGTRRGREPDRLGEILRANLIASKDEEIVGLRDAAVLLEEQLGAAWTYPTAAWDSVVVPERPAFPNARVLVPLATLAGLIVGMLLAIATQGRGRPAERSA
jgi:uncharacterized protein involved in exopolysaccharide biosynthesis